MGTHYTTITTVKPFTFSVFFLRIFFTALVRSHSLLFRCILCYLRLFDFQISLNYILSAMAINRAFLVNFVKVMINGAFKKLILLAPEVGCFLEWVINVDIPAGRRLYEIMKKKADTRSKLRRGRCLQEVPIRSWERSRLDKCDRSGGLHFPSKDACRKTSFCISSSSDFSAKDPSQSRSSTMVIVCSQYLGQLQRDRALYGRWQVLPRSNH